MLTSTKFSNTSDRLVIIILLLVLSVSTYAQYGIYLLDPGYLRKHNIKSVTVYKEFDEIEVPVMLYDYDPSKRIMHVVYYESPENQVEYDETLKLNSKGNFTVIDPETGEALGAPYEFKIIDHFLYDYYPEWEYNSAYDKHGRIAHDTVACWDTEDDFIYSYLRYDFVYEEETLSEVYYWKYDLLGFPNDLQLTTFEWSEDHLRLESHTQPLDHDELVADLNRIIPYSLIYIFSKKGMLINYETESDGEIELYRFEYEFKSRE